MNTYLSTRSKPQSWKQALGKKAARTFVILLFSFSGSTVVLATTPLFPEETRRMVEKLPAVNGTRAIEPEALRNKPVIVTFFASWCPPCRDEFSHLNKLSTRYSDSDLQIIAINVYEEWDENDNARMQRFIQLTLPKFPTHVGTEEIRNLFGGIKRIPTVYGFDRTGELRYQFIHKRNSKKTNATFAELDAAVQQLVSEEQQQAD